MKDQIRYSDYSEELEKGHSSYWKDIGSIAFFLQSALEGLRSNPFFRGSGRLGPPFPERTPSTIQVLKASQYYGASRIECTFAQEDKVSSSFSYNLRSLDLVQGNWTQILSVDPTAASDSWEDQIYSKPLGFTMEEYIEICLHSDLAHFRSVYLDALRLWPKYNSSIIDGCPRVELTLSSSFDLEDYFDTYLLTNMITDESLIRKRYLESVSVLGLPNLRFS